MKVFVIIRTFKAWSSKKDLRAKRSGLVPSHHHPGDVIISVSSGMPRRHRVASLKIGHHPLPQLLFFFFFSGKELKTSDVV